MSRKEEYQLFLQSDFWKKLSLKRKQKSHFKCYSCGSKENLECHHIFYRDKWEDTRLDDLIVLCNKCHKDKHERMNDLNLGRNLLNIRMRELWPKIYKISKSKYHYKPKKIKYESYEDYAIRKYGENWREIVYNT